MSRIKKVIGIDPGLASTGIGIIKGTPQKIASYGYGCIETSPKLPQQYRIHKIYKEITDLVEKEKPSLVIIEDVFSAPKYPKSGILLGKVIGCIMAACSNLGVDIIEIQVRLAKQILTGNGRATKEQLEKAVRRNLNHNEIIKPFHASDALALAMIGIMRGNDRIS